MINPQTPARAPTEEELSDRLRDTLRDISIPPCPAILLAVQEEIAQDEPDVQTLATLIASDVALAAGLIALCNSPYFGLRQRVRSPAAALQMLGLNMSSRAIAGLVLRRAFPATPAMERFWDASATIARVSGWLAQHPVLEGRVRADDAYTFGLFRDCGVPVLWQRFAHYPDLLRRANSDAVLAFTDVEEAGLPTNHAVVGSLLAQSWWLPLEVCQGIRNHHNYHRLGPPADPTALAAAPRNLIALAQLSEHLLQRHTGLSLTQEWGKASEAVQAQLSLDAAQLTRLVGESASVVLPDA